jgi:RsiW-degrading membrane proteinase PrsW (M82 family)
MTVTTRNAAIIVHTIRQPLPFFVVAGIVGVGGGDASLKSRPQYWQTIAAAWISLAQYGHSLFSVGSVSMISSLSRYQASHCGLFQVKSKPSGNFALQPGALLEHLPSLSVVCSQKHSL